MQGAREIHDRHQPKQAPVAKTSQDHSLPAGCIIGVPRGMQGSETAGWVYDVTKPMVVKASPRDVETPKGCGLFHPLPSLTSVSLFTLPGANVV